MQTEITLSTGRKIESWTEGQFLLRLANTHGTKTEIEEMDAEFKRIAGTNSVMCGGQALALIQSDPQYAEKTLRDWIDINLSLIPTKLARIAAQPTQSSPAERASMK